MSRITDERLADEIVRAAGHGDSSVTVDEVISGGRRRRRRRRLAQGAAGAAIATVTAGTAAVAMSLGGPVADGPAGDPGRGDPTASSTASEDRTTALPSADGCTSRPTTCRAVVESWASRQSVPVEVAAVDHWSQVPDGSLVLTVDAATGYSQVHVTVAPQVWDDSRSWQPAESEPADDPTTQRQVEIAEGVTADVFTVGGDERVEQWMIPDGDGHGAVVVRTDSADQVAATGGDDGQIRDLVRDLVAGPTD